MSDPDATAEAEGDSESPVARLLRALAILSIHGAFWLVVIAGVAWLAPVRERGIWLVLGMVAIGSTSQRLYDEFYGEAPGRSRGGSGGGADEPDLTAGPDELTISEEYDSDERQ